MNSLGMQRKKSNYKLNGLFFFNINDDIYVKLFGKVTLF